MADEERLVELERAAARLLERREELKRQSEQRRDERDRLNGSVRSLRAAALEEKSKRDELNGKVAEIKRRVEELCSELEDRRDNLTKIEGDDERSRLPPRGKLEKELRRIEWELSTTPTIEMAETEEQIAERARQIKMALEEHDRLDVEQDKKLVSLADSKAVQLKIRGSVEEMQELHEKSQEHHERMLRLYSEAEEEKKRADEAHARLLETIAAIRDVNAELEPVLGEANEIKGRLRRSEKASSTRRARDVEERKRELREEAQRKLDAGEKLGFEELKLLYEDDEEGDEEEPSDEPDG